LEAKRVLPTDLANKIGVSKSYVSQVFSGDKKVNCLLLAKIQKALDIRFEVKAIGAELAFIDEVREDESWNETQLNTIIEKYKHRGGAFIYKSNLFNADLPSQQQSKPSKPTINLTAA
jgi:transcriptional regulator with XRE-family HTH domain